ncbi:MAG: TonB-dependent receptor plug domain-containing protein [Bacteroidota bacterium]
MRKHEPIETTLAYLTRIPLLRFGLLSLGVCLGYSLTAQYAHSTTVHLTDERSLYEVFDAIEQQTPFVFAYDQGVKDVHTSNRLGNEITVDAVLAVLAKENDLDFRRIDQTIYVKSRPRKTLVQQADQRGSLAGAVTDEEGNQLPGVTVRLLETPYGAVTNTEGRFAMRNIPAGTYSIELKSVGFEKHIQTVKINSEETTRLQLKMMASLDELEAVVIRGESAKEKMESTSQAVLVVETKKAQMQTADLGEVMARTEGVSVQRSGGLGSNTRFSLNGLTDDQIRFFMDGIPLTAMGHVNGVANVPVNTVERVEVYKGVVPIQFGADALGGAVNLVSNSEYEGTHGQLSYQVGSFNTHRLAGFVQHRPINRKYFLSGSAFLDKTDNNYWVDVEIPDERGRVEQRRVRRFHDGYSAFGASIEAGFRDIKIADKLSIRAFHNGSEKDVQHNLIMVLPFGETFWETSSHGGFIDWRKEILPGLKISNVAGFSENQTIWVDTASVVYKWDGTLARDLEGEIVRRQQPGENGSGSDAVFSDWTYYDRIFANYLWGSKHQIKLSSAPTLLERSGRNRQITDPADVDRLALRNKLFNLINGVEYEFKPTDRLEWTVFGKNYIQRLNTEQVMVQGVEIDVVDLKRNTHNWGVGTGVRLALSERLSAKLTYERATRLPNAIEVFGDGLFIGDNVEIQPERSHNANVDVKYVQRAANKADFQVSISGFLRQVDSLIVLLGSGMTFIHDNVANASSKGLELNYSWTSANERFEINGNGTWLDFRNVSEGGRFEPFKGDRIPNRPYLFSNANIGYKIPNLLGRQNHLQLFVGGRYVHEFFRGWESIGDPNRKQFIPSQFTQNVGITQDFQWHPFKLNLTLEVQNISNATVFDFFGVQRPGRNFNTKLLMKF